MKNLISPKELAMAIGVSESTLKRWVDDGLLEVTRTVGGHRRIPLCEALRFVRHTRATIIRPELLNLSELALARQEMESAADMDEAVFDALHDGRSCKVRGLILGQYLAGRPLTEICDGPVRSAMHRLGELWQHGPEGILIEHRATDICLQAFNQIRSLVRTPDDGAALAIGGAPEHDPYALPTLLAATVLADAGWRTMNLGPQTPMDVLAQAARAHGAQLVWLSCSASGPSGAVAEAVTHLSALLADTHARLVVGGRALGPHRPPETDRLALAGSMADLLRLAAQPAAA